MKILYVLPKTFLMNRIQPVDMYQAMFLHP